MSFITYAKHLNVSDITETLSERITNHNKAIVHIDFLVSFMKQYDTKKITKRIETKIKETYKTTYLKYIAGMTYILIDGEQYHLSNYDIFYYDKWKEDIMAQLEVHKQYIEKYTSAINESILDKFVNEYNTIVDNAKTLVDNAEKFKLEYFFDVCNNNK